MYICTCKYEYVYIYIYVHTCKRAGILLEGGEREGGGEPVSAEALLLRLFREQVCVVTLGFRFAKNPQTYKYAQYTSSHSMRMYSHVIRKETCLFEW